MQFAGGDFLIFVAVGTHPQQFNRLLEALDGFVAAGKIKEEVFAQSGASSYRPKNFKSKDFMGLEEFMGYVKRASLVITHGGEGVIGTALQMEKPLVVVPRLRRFGEHTNDHQLELTRAVAGEGAAVAVYDISKLNEAISEARNLPKKKTEHARGILKIIGAFAGGGKFA